MAVASTLELAGSPAELASTAPQTAFYWDPRPELLAGETVTSPVCVVRQYDPRYPVDTTDVTAAVLAVGAPVVIPTDLYAGQVQVLVKAGALTAGYEYRVELSATGSQGTAPWRYFRIRCLL